MDVNRTIRVILEKEDIQRLLNGETINNDGFEIRPGYDISYDKYVLTERKHQDDEEWVDE